MHVGVIPERNVLQTDGTFLITNIFSFSTETLRHSQQKQRDS
jgi:hypothetical protein